MGLRIMVIDDEKLALARLVRTVKAALPDAVVYDFDRVSEALEQLKQLHHVDILFTDIEMPNMSGLMLARKVKEESPDTCIVFVTGYSQYAVEAFSINANGYLQKPVTAEMILRQINYLEHPMPALKHKKLKVQCFGNFEVFANDHPVEIKREKSKEIFAYLVDRRGASVSGGELSAILWEDKANTPSSASYLRHLYAELTMALRNVNAEEVLIKGRNSYAINPDSIDCDFYRFLAKDPAAVNTYRGEYMTQYSWAEMTLAAIE